jgi:putative transposase
MKAGRFSEEQIIHLMQRAEHDEQPIGVLCREHGISEQTFYRWRRKFGGMTVPNTQRLRELEVDALKAVLAKKS